MERIQMNRKQSLRDKAYLSIREDITSGKLKPNDILLEIELANKLKMSRTPIREAFLRLENDGLVKIYPQKGAIVSKLDLEDIIQLSQTRAALEGMAARLACRSMQMDKLCEIEHLLKNIGIFSDLRDVEYAYKYCDMLHELILETAGNKVIIKYVDNLMIQFCRIKLKAREAPHRAEQNLAEHLRIVDALKRRDPDLVEREMRNHIINVQDDVLYIIKSRSDY
jgi:DNA-binding GntR family transcriptional regulator